MDKQFQLTSSLDNIELLISNYTKKIVRPYKDHKALGNRLWTLLEMFRSRGILRFLLQADVNGFFEDMHRVALSYVTLLQAWYHQCDVKKSRVNAYTEMPLACAMAAGNFALAREIDTLMPRQLDDRDSEEAYTYTTMLRTLATGDEQALTPAFQTFQRTCTGKFRFDHKIAIIDGLVRKDAATFNQALGQYLDSFENLPPEEAEELDPGDDDIDVEGLAFVQLARHRGIPLTLTHRMLPPELLDARRVLPRDGYPAWP